MKTECYINPATKWTFLKQNLDIYIRFLFVPLKFIRNIFYKKHVFFHKGAHPVLTFLNVLMIVKF